MNRTLKVLMLSDLTILTGFGLTGPIFSIFIKENLIGGTILAAGIATTIYILVKSIVQLPFSRYVDAHDRRKMWILIGTFLIACVPFIYVFSTHIWHIFVAQALFGFANGLAYPVWVNLWSTHLDKGHESFEWSVYSTVVGLSVASTASIGAAIAQFLGFQMTFVFVGIMSFLGFLVLFFLENKYGKVQKKKMAKQYQIKRRIANNHK